jgi:hypothetical protein
MKYKVEHWRGRSPRKVALEDQEDPIHYSDSNDETDLSEELPLDFEAISSASLS